MVSAKLKGGAGAGAGDVGRMGICVVEEGASEVACCGCEEEVGEGEDCGWKLLGEGTLSDCAREVGEVSELSKVWVIEGLVGGRGCGCGCGW